MACTVFHDLVIVAPVMKPPTVALFPFKTDGISQLSPSLSLPSAPHVPPPQPPPLPPKSLPLMEILLYPFYSFTDIEDDLVV